MCLDYLKKVSPVAVHFVLPDELGPDLTSLGLVVMEGTLSEVRTDHDLFAVVSAAMQFPEYFGSNWDALDECLGDMDWLPSEGYLLVLRDAAKGWSQSAYTMGRFVKSWLEASEYWVENKTSFHLLFVM